MAKKLREITIDIETLGNMTNGKFDVLAQELTVACIHDSSTGEFSSFYQNELSKLWPILESADAIIGYNTEHFDLPVLNKYYAGDLTKIRSIDLLKEVQNVIGRRLRLDNIAEATLGRHKTGSGLQGVQWWKNGEYEKVRDYCIEDVLITRDVYDYALTNKSLKYKDFDGIRDIKLVVGHWRKPTQPIAAITHTLPW